MKTLERGTDMDSPLFFIVNEDGETYPIDLIALGASALDEGIIAALFPPHEEK